MLYSVIDELINHWVTDLDFSKAFDTVNLNILVKLVELLLSWLEVIYLIDRNM